MPNGKNLRNAESNHYEFKRLPNVEWPNIQLPNVQFSEIFIFQMQLFILGSRGQLRQVLLQAHQLSLEFLIGPTSTVKLIAYKL